MEVQCLQPALLASGVAPWFQLRGTFRQSRVDKGRTRDTAWFSVIDSEWPALQACFARWLAPDNFDAQGHQRLRLDPHIACAALE